jgi:tetratricopeptide (TPR) repeat protein
VGSRSHRPARASASPRPSEPSAGAQAEGSAEPRLGRPKRLMPEDHLERAMAATSPRTRAAWARRGLAHRGPLDRTTQTLLLRQLYLAHFAERGFEQAWTVAEQALALGVLPDVIHQDAARARQAAGDHDVAVGHLRLAARLGPPSRRAFHLWTLGSVLFLAGHPAEAISAFGRAARWGTTDKPLYEGHLAAAKLAAGMKVRNLDGIIERLALCPAGQGYGRFVLGLLSLHAGQAGRARDYLEAFVARTERGQLTAAIALEGEVALARQTLAALAAR